MEYTEAQQQVIDRYYEATKDNPEERMPIEKLIGMKNKFPRSRPDRNVIAKCEESYLEDDTLREIKAGRKKREIDNAYVSSVLKAYPEYWEARRHFYWLDDVLTGVSRCALEGSTRPLSVSLLFDFMSTSTVIDTDLISTVCDVKERQAQKIMLALVVANRVIEKELKRMGKVVDEIQLDEYALDL